MYKIRKIKTASGKTAVQVITYIDRKTKIIKHIGSADSNHRIKFLEEEAKSFIESIQPPLFNSSSIPSFEIIDTKRNLLYKTLHNRYQQIFKNINHKLLQDLCIIRIAEPASKMQSLRLLRRYFGIDYSLENLYRKLPNILKLKKDIENASIKVAKERLNFDFTFVLYDVTTLHFETNRDDDLRKCGFSKDGKFHKPQILIGLIVTKEGFPVGLQVFEGNKFEGHTLLPSILQFKQDNSVKNLTVVADAAMISKENIAVLKQNQLNYIVGARINNMPQEIINEIENNIRKGKDLFRLKNNKEYLVCEFSRKRYNKDKHELEKQIYKAEASIKYPSKMLNRYKFVKKNSKDKYELNKELIKKTKKLLGVKGYVTNLESQSDIQIVEKYKQLWNVEKSFRMAKNDLEARPIYHRKEDSIKAHILICFMAMCVSRLMEIDSNMSIKRIIETLKTVIDGEICINETGETFYAPGKIDSMTEELLKLLNLSY